MRIEQRSFASAIGWRPWLEKSLPWARPVAHLSTREASSRFLARFRQACAARCRRTWPLGIRLELDGIAGPVLRQAAEHGIAVPMTKELVEMILRQISGWK